MTEGTIFHIAERVEWDAATQAGSYAPTSLDSEGFIHLSTRAQVLATAARYYEGVSGLVLLGVDVETLDRAHLRFERSTGGQDFPHYYARIPTSCVVSVSSFEPLDDGSFVWPSDLAV